MVRRRLFGFGTWPSSLDSFGEGFVAPLSVEAAGFTTCCFSFTSGILLKLALAIKSYTNLILRRFGPSPRAAESANDGSGPAEVDGLGDTVKFGDDRLSTVAFAQMESQRDVDRTVHARRTDGPGAATEVGIPACTSGPAKRIRDGSGIAADPMRRISGVTCVEVDADADAVSSPAGCAPTCAFGGSWNDLLMRSSRMRQSKSLLLTTETSRKSESRGRRKRRSRTRRLFCPGLETAATSRKLG